MQYKDFAPTPLDRKGAFLDDRGEWEVVPVSRNRDSGSLSISNFRTALEMLGGEGGAVEVHRFGHWGPGWFEIILVDPSDRKKMEVLQDIKRSLEDYPVLDEEDLSRREWEEAQESWTWLNLGERMDLCKRAGISIFAARSESIPDEGYGMISQRLLTR